jgi:hypothetical protein
MTPSFAAFDDLFVAADMPFLRKWSIAFSKSPPDPVRASLQSIIPAPVFSLSSLTIDDVTLNLIYLPSNFSL